MKWIKTRAGDIRERSGFLFFPKGNRNIRWLEKASWTEIYDSHYGWIFYCWEDREFRDD